MGDKLAAAILCLALMGGAWSVPALAAEGMAVHYSDVFQGRPTATFSTSKP